MTLKPKWDAKAIKAYESGQGVKLVNIPHPHYEPLPEDLNPESLETVEIDKEHKPGEYIPYRSVFPKKEYNLPVDRNDVLEEVAKEFDKMPFGDTAASFARFVRDMKK